MSKDVFKGIADPVRRQIIALLAHSPLNINQVHEYFPAISRQAVSKHLAVLEACGILKIYKAGRERYGYLYKPAFKELHTWLQPFVQLEEHTLHNDYEVFLNSTQHSPGTSFSYPVMLQAMLSKDADFDGTFYIAVKTTGIFCKPSCSARPKPENVLFYHTKEEAIKNGYRACKICKP